MLSVVLATELLLVAAGLGLAAVASPSSIPLPRFGRFAFGVAATPFVVGSTLLLTTLIWPGIPTRMLAFAPCLLGLGLVALNLRKAGSLIPVTRSIRISRDPLWLLQLAGIAIVVSLVGVRLAYYLQQPTGNSDGLQYLEQAKDFVKHRNFFEISGIWGRPDGTLRGDAHGSLWIAYLASGLSWGVANGHLADETLIRLPFQASLVLFLPAVIAFASALRPRYIVFLSILASLAVPNLFGASIGGDRDAFRLSGLLLLAAFLLAHLRPGISRGSRPSVWILAATLSAFAVQGHGLAQILVPLTVAIWFLVALIARLPVLRSTLVSGAAAIGFLIGASHVIGAYYSTGSVMGDNVISNQQVQGTVYEKGIIDRDAARVGEGGDWVVRLGITVTRDHGWPSMVGLLVLLSGAAFLAKRSSSKRPLAVIEWRPVLVGAWFFMNSLLLLGAFDIGSMQLGAWTVMNPRYAMQWYLAAALLAAWGIGAAISAVEAYNHSLGRSLGIVSILVLSLGTALLITRTWLYYPTPGYINLTQKLNAAAQGLPSSCRILSEDTGVSFYAERPVVQLYDKSQRTLLQAKDAITLDRLLAERNLCAVVLYTGLYIDMAGPDTPFTQLLGSEVFTRVDALPWRIYLRKSPNS